MLLLLDFKCVEQAFLLCLLPSFSIDNWKCVNVILKYSINATLLFCSKYLIKCFIWHIWHVNFSWIAKPTKITKRVCESQKSYFKSQKRVLFYTRKFCIFMKKGGIFSMKIPQIGGVFEMGSLHTLCGYPLHMGANNIINLYNL